MLSNHGYLYSRAKFHYISETIGVTIELGHVVRSYTFQEVSFGTKNADGDRIPGKKGGGIVTGGLYYDKMVGDHNIILGEGYFAKVPTNGYHGN